MKIFLDDFCFNTVVAVDQQSEIYKKYQQLNQLPSDCDLVSITFNNNNYLAHTDIIQQLLKKTRQLIVVLLEPTEFSPGEFYQFARALDDPKILIFSPAVTNFSASNLLPLITWFDQATNYYATESWAKKLQSQLYSGLDRPKKFDCLLGVNKPHRDQIEQLYKASAYQDQFIYSYFKNQVNQGIWSRDVDKVETTTHRVRVDTHGNFVAISVLLPVDIYNETFYSIVAETVCTNHYSHFTEKTAKTFVAGRPFVMFSGQYFLRNLHGLGFQTFGSVIDESYDAIEDDVERFARAWREVERLCQLDPAMVMQQLQPVLTHNQQHFLLTDWMHPLTEYIQSIKSGATGVI